MHGWSLLKTMLSRHAREVWRKFAEDNCLLIAAAMSFYALLSMVPLILLAVSVLGFVLEDTRAHKIVLDFVAEQLPGLREEIRDELRRMVEAQHWTGWVGLLGLVWAAGHVFLNLEVALNLAWHAHHRRTVLQRQLLATTMTVLAGVPLQLSILLTIAITTLRRLTVPIVGWKLDAVPLVWNVTAELVPVLLTIGSMTAIYRWVPYCPVRWRSALIGGTVAGVLWELAKRLFAYYTASLAQFGALYGPFVGIVGLMLWIYYSALILLLGAEIAAVAQSVHPIVPDPETNEAEERLREVDAPGV